jgi:hypothetical protein
LNSAFPAASPTERPRAETEDVMLCAQIISGSSGVDVMITIFCDFRQFRQKMVSFVFVKTKVLIKILEKS